MNKSIYTVPKLCKAKNGWYVHFRYNGVQKRYNVANREKNLKIRKRIADHLIKTLSAKLKKGWNPVTEIQESKAYYSFSGCLEDV